MAVPLPRHTPGAPSGPRPVEPPAAEPRSVSARAPSGRPPSPRAAGTRLQLGDEVAARIRELIVDGIVRPGEHLRLEHLAAEFRISVTPVREALKSLRAEGFVVLEPRRGFVVAPLSKQDVADLFWVQAGIAAELTARAAARLDGAALGDLDAAHLALEHARTVRRPDLMEQHNGTSTGGSTWPPRPRSSPGRWGRPPGTSRAGCTGASPTGRASPSATTAGSWTR